LHCPAIRIAPEKRVHLDAGEIAPLRGIAHGAGDMREAATE